MSALALTVALPGAPPSWTGRVLATYVAADAREARAFLSRNVDTFRSALEPGELRFIALATDRDGRLVFARAYPRAIDSEPTEYRRAALREMRGQR